MAVNKVRWLTFMGGWVTVDLWFDNDDGVDDPDIEAYRIECHAPVELVARIFRNSNYNNPWRETLMTDGFVWEDTAPFGPVKKVDDMAFEIGHP